MKSILLLLSSALSLIYKTERDFPLCLIINTKQSPNIRVNTIKKSSSFDIVPSIYSSLGSKEKLDSKHYVNQSVSETFSIDLALIEGSRVKVCIGIELGTAEFTIDQGSVSKSTIAEISHISSALKLISLLEEESNGLSVKKKKKKNVLKMNKNSFESFDFWLKICSAVKIYLLVMTCFALVVLMRKIRFTAKYSHVV